MGFFIEDILDSKDEIFLESRFIMIGLNLYLDIFFWSKLEMTELIGRLILIVLEFDQVICERFHKVLN